MEASSAQHHKFLPTQQQNTGEKRILHPGKLA